VAPHQCAGGEHEFVEAATEAASLHLGHLHPLRHAILSVHQGLALVIGDEGDVLSFLMEGFGDAVDYRGLART
jgi:hypothetical protein